MSFIGTFTRNETIRLWVNFIKLDGTATIPVDVTIVIKHGGVELVNAPMVQEAPGSNIFYYDYTVPNLPTEGNVFAIYYGTIDGIICEDHDYFKIDLIKDRVLENRLGNQRILFYPATASNPVRKTYPGVLDYQVIETKFDDDADWSTPRSTKTLWFWYANAGDVNPVKVGESD